MEQRKVVHPAQFIAKIWYSVSCQVRHSSPAFIFYLLQICLQCPCTELLGIHRSDQCCINNGDPEVSSRLSDGRCCAQQCTDTYGDELEGGGRSSVGGETEGERTRRKPIRKSLSLILLDNFDLVCWIDRYSKFNLIPFRLYTVSCTEFGIDD